MNFHETIQLQALRLKELNTRGSSPPAFQEAMLEAALKQNPDAPLKNICAMVSIDLFERVEECCKQLELSKRRFVEMALREALRQAETIVAEVDPFVGEEH